MIQCPECGHTAVAKSSSKISDGVKHYYNTCKNPDCLCTFRSTETIDHIIRPPLDKIITCNGFVADLLNEVPKDVVSALLLKHQVGVACD